MLKGSQVPGACRPIDFDQFVGISHLQAGGPHHQIPGLQAGDFGDAVADHPVDARRTVAVHQHDAEPADAPAAASRPYAAT